MKSKFILTMILCLFNLVVVSQPLEEIQKLLASNVDEHDSFGFSVSMYGDYAIVGAHNSSGNKGCAYIYKNNSGIWEQVTLLTAFDASSNDHFGYSVDICEKYAIIGAYGDSDKGDYSGSAYIFYNNNGNWIFNDKLTASDGSEYDWFGFSVSITNEYVIIGAMFDDVGDINSGSAYIFKNNSDDWQEQVKLFAQDGQYWEEFGNSVSIYGNYAVVGVAEDKGLDIWPKLGSAYIYYNNNGNWEHTSKLLASDNDNEKFGRSVCVYDNYIIVGAPYDYNNNIRTGSAYIFYNESGNWIEQTKLIPSDGAENDMFGVSVDITNTNAIIGAELDGDNGDFSGSAYLYYNIDGSWKKQIKLLASDGRSIDEFGSSVASASDIILVGAYLKDDNGENSGAAYIFQNQENIKGNIYNDISEDCIQNIEEQGLGGKKAIINPGNIIVETYNSGIWGVRSLPVGNYTITVDTTGKWMQTCPTTQNFTVEHSDSLTLAPSFGFISTEPCSEPEISIKMPIIRRCFNNQMIYVQVCNKANATGALNDAYVDVELNHKLTLMTSSVPYVDLGNNLYRFDIGTINPSICSEFWINTNVSCFALNGETLCIKANLFPADDCVFESTPSPPTGEVMPCELPWDKSSLHVDGWCENDSIYFSVINTGEYGEGDMQCWSAVRVFIDGDYMMLDSVLLTGGESKTYTYTGDGRTWRLEADQHPLHPGNSHPNASIELCGNKDNWTPGLVNLLPHDDSDPVIDIFCGVVTGSFDPNDKAGSPFGIGTNHYIYPNRKIDYLIRFQNTGTDTAFKVVLRDTLDMDLDIFTVIPGASSHDYYFKMYGPRVLEWTFYNILLPDSNVNEPESHGFVSYSVNQIPNLTDGTEITNKAGIYFDYNDPVITNTVSNIVNRGLNSPSWSVEKSIIAEDCFYTYNGITYTQTGTYYQIVKGGANADTLTTLNLIINAPDNSVIVNENTIKANAEDASYQWVDCNNANAPLVGETNQSFTASVNGNYAVIVTNETCTDISECIQISSLGITDNLSHNKITLYPNPTDGKITVKSNENDIRLIRITDITGRIIIEKDKVNPKEEIDLSGFGNGIYIISIQTDKGVLTSKIVKQ